MAASDGARRAVRHSVAGIDQGTHHRRPGRSGAGSPGPPRWAAPQPPAARRVRVRRRQAALCGPVAELAVQCA
ncbi:hypothetical protein G6F24_018564 [Rhizopus arrhizus]|nr:hypothetical protein G6F24_018564 [Rhizopus arrhizus]